MNQAQHDFIERLMVENPGHRIEWHERPFGVLVDAKEPARGRERTVAILLLDQDGKVGQAVGT